MTWSFDIDIRRDLLTGVDDVEIFALSFGEELNMSGGPVGYFIRKYLLCYVEASPKVSLTSVILVDMLCTMNKLNVFPRVNGRNPFLLLDGHHSRFETSIF